jgi:hypothetical protein
MAITDLRILPPLAIARLGSSPEPLDNYDVVVDPDKPLGARQIVPAETLVVDGETGALTAKTPSAIRFKDDEGRVRPVAPFVEVWAVVDGQFLEPLSTALLAANGASPSDVVWHVEVGNIKAFRRTRDDGDRILAATGPFSDHAAHELHGVCDHFLPGKAVPFGSVRYIRPTEAFPQVRLRFTPATGKVYGAAAGDPNIADVVYDASKGRWRGYSETDQTVAPALTAPSQTYAGDNDAKGNYVSRGYLDDECDGIIDVRLTIPAATGGPRQLSAFARIGAGPPSFAPDGFPVRSVADELEQALSGPLAVDEAAPLADAEETVRRAFETVRLMNTAVMNGNTIDGLTGVARTMVLMDSYDFARLFQPIAAPALVDNLALRALHQTVFTALRSGCAPWFADALREYTEIADLSDLARRKMPALMRGADGRLLALTRRQVDRIRRAATRHDAEKP